MHSVMSGSAASRIVGRIAPAADRGPTWGSMQVRPEPYGIVWYKLSVYPPGTDAQTRRWLRAREAWGGAGLVCAVATAILLMIVLPPAVALALALGLYAIAWVVFNRHAGAARRRTRRLIAMDYGARSTREEVQLRTRLRGIASTLVDADRSLHAGRITPAEHELVWAAAFDELGAR
jgi:hypothetical protein